MPMTTYPLNNVEYDAEAAELFHCTRTSGIFADSHFDISVTGDDNILEIGKGIAWIKNTEFSGKVAAQKETIFVDAGISDSLLPRIDAVAIRFEANSNSTNIIVKTGTPSSSPVPPTVEREEYAYELHLYHIIRRAGATSISPADISDLRLNSNYCGLMADSVTSVDTEAIEAQVKGLIKRLDAAIAQTQGGTGFMTKTLLWENEDPDAEFSSQSLPVLCANYDGIEIVCHKQVYQREVWDSGFIPYRAGASVAAERISIGDSTGMWSRSFVLRTDSIYVGTGRFEGLEVNSTRNDFMIPVKIYGYTGVIDPNSDNPPAGQNPSHGEIMFDLDVDMSTSGRLRFTNDQQMQKVYDNNMAIHVVYCTEQSGARHVFECTCPSVKSVLPIGSASDGAVVFASGYYHNQNENSRFIISLYFDPSKFAEDETLEVIGGSYMAIPAGATVARVYASIF